MNDSMIRDVIMGAGPRASNWWRCVRGRLSKIIRLSIIYTDDPHPRSTLADQGPESHRTDQERDKPKSTIIRPNVQRTNNKKQYKKY